MSQDLFAYTPYLNLELIPKILSRLDDFGIACELHPATVILDETQPNDWYLCVKMKFQSNGPQDIIGKEILTGFECGASNFEYESALRDFNDIQRPISRPNIIEKLFLGSKASKWTPKDHFADGQNIDAKLKKCSKVFEINYHRESEELISFGFACILAELTDGIFFNPQTEEYLEGKDAVTQIPELMSMTGVEWEMFEVWPD